MNAPHSEKKILSTNLFPVVGIGASAGGLEAFKRFLKAIPVDSGLAYVLVQHLDPKHKSILPSLLQQVTRIPVVEITDDIKVEPDHIYIIPSNKTLVANDGVLELSKRPEKGVRHLPIDLFFTSLAEVHESHAIGVVLSGNATDGTLGLKAIKDKGGLTFAQDGPSAANEGMPHSAATAGVVDFIMPPEKIPAKLLELKQHLLTIDNKELEEEGKLEAYKNILSVLQKRKGTDFTHYKASTIMRRIERRMSLHNESEQENYLGLLKDQPLEQDALYQDLLIPVTTFFRDPSVFSNLCHSVFPRLLQNKPADQPIRIWIAGCSTGQEAYSMAMCVKEFLGEHEEKVQIFATDISEPAIAKARKGIYNEDEIKGLNTQRLQLFFTKTKDGYQVVKELRDKCVFAVHDFLKDAPFGKLDFVSCRNVLIYMSPVLQKKALTTFHYGLNPEGLLLLGKSETVTTVPRLFTIVDKAAKLFSRKEAASHFSHQGTSLSQQPAAPKKKVSPTARTNNDIEKTADAVLLADHMPAGVVVNEALDVVLFRGSTGNYLEAPAGKPSTSLLKLARTGLAFELRNLLQKAKRDGVSIVKEGIPLIISGNRHLISIEVVPLANLAEAHWLVLFRDNGPAHPAGSKPLDSRDAAGQKDLNEQHILQLEKELAQLRDDMRTVTAEQDVINEELQSANEELLSGNEELQSLNEELETSKEELESTNEELTSLNEQVNAARQYAESIVETIREPVVVLDQELRVKSANQAFYSMFRVVKEQTEGFLIYDLANKQWDIPALRTLLEDIMPRQSNFTGFEVRHHFQTIGERVMLLNALEMKRSKDEEKLILLAIEDITESAQRLLKKKELLTRFQNLVMQAPVAMCILKGEEHVVEVANNYYLQLLAKNQDFIDKPLFESMPELQHQGIQELLDGVWKSGTPYYGFEHEVWIERNGTRDLCYFNFVYQPMRELDKSVTGIIVVVAEVTEQVVARKRMESQATMVNNLMMTAPGFVCTLVGPDHVYSLVNDRYQSLFGSRSIKGKPIMVALPELVGQGIDQLLDKVYQTGEPYLGIDIPITLARDENLLPEERYFNFSYQPMYDDSKTIFSILVFGYEVTEQVLAKNRILDLQQKHAALLEEQVQQRTTELWEANKALLQKNEELLKANLELESFNYISSHDLQEPLRKIMTYVSLIQGSEATQLSEKGKSYFATIQESATRMRTLIADLMTYSVTDVKDRKFLLTDMRQLLNDVKSELAPLIRQSAAELDIERLCPLAVNVSQFRQVFINLISNAIKFCPGTSPRIRIASKQLQWQELHDEVPPVILGILSHKGDYCRIQVEDNGIGFDPKFKDKIFEVFQRLHGKETYPGNGIGLAIVKKIVEHHGGFITADSKLGQGSTFSIYLPHKEPQ